jgi:acetyl-CoA carboxylase biotin carboxylase subunit
LFGRVLVANRGEIASRLIRACHAVRAQAIAVYSDADVDAPYVREADEAVAIGPAAPAESYLNIARIIDAARESGSQAVIPGYGFLSENPDFGEACLAAGLAWVGPPPDAMRAMADKLEARRIVVKAGVPVVPGSDGPVGTEQAGRVADVVGYPVMVKAARGGGGIGMTLVRNETELSAALETATARAQAAFGDATVFIERYVEHPRHIEVQVMGEADGRVFHLYERECSVQRRHQKVIEETPSQALDSTTRSEICQAAVGAAEAVGYRSAGTVEFIFSAGNFYFLEMNTRLQVEHPITEETLGVDIPVMMLRIAAGEPVSPGVLRRRGHAIEFRVYAEDPVRFLPSPGLIETWEPPAGRGVRVDSGVAAGYKVSHFYDPLLAKLVVSGRNRKQAIERAVTALQGFRVEGVKTNLSIHLEVLQTPEFRSGDYDTGLLGVIGSRKTANAGNPAG